MNYSDLAKPCRVSQESQYAFMLSRSFRSSGSAISILQSCGIASNVTILAIDTVFAFV